MLTLVADLKEEVRILDGHNLLARHVRSYDKGAQIEDPTRTRISLNGRLRRRVLEDPSGEEADALCINPAQDGHIDMQDFRRALDAVPPEQREALLLVAVAGFSY